MGIKENGKAHFREMISGDLLSIDVPEWGGKVYYRRVVCALEQSKIMQLYESGQHSKAVAMVLVIRALKEDGTRIWLEKDMSELMREYDPEIMGDVVNKILEGQPDHETIKKN